MQSAREGAADRDAEADDGGPEHEAPAAEDAPRRRWYSLGIPRNVLLVMLGAALISLGIGLYCVLVVYPTCPAPTFFGEKVPTAGCFTKINGGDAVYFRTQADLLSRGYGFASPAAWVSHSPASDAPAILPGAGHPPVYTLFLAGLFSIGLESITQQRVVECVMVALGVFLIGVAAYKIAGKRGPTVGPIAAVLAATYPMIWINSFRYLSESIYVAIVAVLLMSAYGFWRRPTYRSAAWFGLMVGVASLTRGEGIFMLAFTLLPLLWGMREMGRATLVKLGATVCAGTFVLLAPWVIFNMVRFGGGVYITSGTGSVLLYGSCDAAFEGEGIGYYSFLCGKNQPTVTKDPLMVYEDHVNEVAQQQATTYLKEHASQYPGVAIRRVGRMWDVYAPFQNAGLNEFYEGRGRFPSLAGLWYYWALLPFGIYGAVVLYRRRVALSPILGLAAAVTLTAALSFGVTRYRIPADVGLVMLAAVGLDVLVQRARVALAASDEHAVDPDDPDGDIRQERRSAPSAEGMSPSGGASAR